jgi:hypothetical protein
VAKKEIVESGTTPRRLHDFSPVHPTGQYSEKCPQVDGHVLRLSGRHAKLRAGTDTGSGSATVGLIGVLYPAVQTDDVCQPAGGAAAVNQTGGRRTARFDRLSPMAPRSLPARAVDGGALRKDFALV